MVKVRFKESRSEKKKNYELAQEISFGSDEVRGICFDGEKFFASCYECGICSNTFDENQDEYVIKYHTKETTQFCGGVFFCESRGELIALFHRSVKIFNLSTGSLRRNSRNLHRNGIVDIHIIEKTDDQEAIFITSSLDNTCKIFSRKRIAILGTLNHPEIVWSSLQMPNKDVITSCADSKIYVWNGPDYKDLSIKATISEHKGGSVTGLDFTYDPENSICGFVSCGDDGFLNFFDLDYKLVTSSLAHRSKILKVKSYEQYIISCSEDRRAHLWMRSTDGKYELKRIFQHPDTVFNAIVIPGSYDIITCCGNGKMYVWRIGDRERIFDDTSYQHDLIRSEQKERKFKVEEYTSFDTLNSAMTYLSSQQQKEEETKRRTIHGDLKILNVDGLLRVFEFDEIKNDWNFLCFFVEYLEKQKFLKFSSSENRQQQEEENEGEEEEEDIGYESPDDETDLEYDQETNTTFKFIRKLENEQLHERKDFDQTYRYCDSCAELIVEDGYFHCFECAFRSVDLCEPCYRSGVFHRHEGIDYFSYIPTSRHRIRGEIFRKKKKDTKLMTCRYTLLKCFEYYSDRYFMGIRSQKNENNYQWIKFCEVERYVRHLSLVLHERKNWKNEPCFIGIISNTCVEYVIIDFCCLYSGFVSVPIQRILTPEKKRKIIENTNISIVFCSTEYFDELVHEVLKNDIPPSLQLIVTFHTNEILSFNKQQVEEGTDPKSVGHGIEVVSLESLFSTFSYENNNNNNLLLQRMSPPSIEIREEDKYITDENKDKIITLVHTSGSTGDPKAVVFRESEYSKNFRKEFKILPLVGISYAPLSHNNGRFLVVYMMTNGGRMGFLTDSEITNFYDDCKTLRPTILSIIPRLMNFVYSEFKEKVSTNLLSTTTTTESEKKAIKTMVFREFQKREIFGDRIMKMSIGGALSSFKIKRFFRNLLMIPINDSYGSTEVGPITFNYRYKPNELHKIRDCPSLGYFGTDRPYPRGELMVKVDQTVEYFSSQSITRSNNDNDNENSEKWYATGDIVEIRKGNKMVVIDRKSNILKMSNGEFISLEQIENLIVSKSQMIDQIVLLTNTFEIVGLIVPISVKEEQEQEVLSTTKKNIHSEIIEICLSSKLNTWETPSNIMIVREKFTAENGMLTLTQKKNRKKISERYKSEINRLYNTSKNQGESLENIISKILGLSQDEQQQQQEEENDDEKDISEMTFTQLGGDSLSALTLMNELKKRGEMVSFEQLTKLSISQLSELLKKKKETGDDEEEKVNETPNFEGIKKEISEILERFKKRKLEKEEEEEEGEEGEREMKGIFITGATGFLGSFILKDLVEEFASAEIWALTRSEEKLRETVSNFVFIEEVDTKQKVKAVVGDLGLPNFGMADEEFEGLAKKLDLIIHCGAFVHHFFHYKDLFDANVRSAKDIVALSRGGETPVFYVSSTSVYSSPKEFNRQLSKCSGEKKPFDIENIRTHKSSRGYSTSKWVADCIFSKYVPNCTVFRPSFIFGCTKTGRTNPKDWMNIFLSSVMEYKIAPNAQNTQNHLDFVPVDFVSEVITKCAKKQRLCAGKQFNISCRNIRVTDIFDATSTFLENDEKNNTPLTRLPMKEWIDRVIELESAKLRSEFLPFSNSLRKNLKIGSDYNEISGVDVKAEELLKEITNDEDFNVIPVYTESGLLRIVEHICKSNVLK